MSLHINSEECDRPPHSRQLFRPSAEISLVFTSSIPNKHMPVRGQRVYALARVRMERINDRLYLHSTVCNLISQKFVNHCQANFFCLGNILVLTYPVLSRSLVVLLRVSIYRLQAVSSLHVSIHTKSMAFSLSFHLIFRSLYKNIVHAA